MKKYLSAFFCILLSYYSYIDAQDLYSNKAKNIIAGAKHVRLNQQNGKIEFFELEPGAKLNQKRQKDNFGTFLCDALHLSSDFNFKPIMEFTDKKGEKHIRYQQFLNGIPIEGMVYIGHFKNDIVLRANGYYSTVISTKKQVAVSKFNGLEIAKGMVPSEQYYESEEQMSQKVEIVYLLIDSQPVLCYKYDIYSLKPLDRKYVYVNTETGKVEKTISRIQNSDRVGTAHTMYSGQREITTDSVSGYYRLYENGRATNIHTLNLNNGSSYSSATEIIDYDNVWDSTFQNYNAVYDAHFGAEMTYDYYYTKFGRNSFDNNGAAIISYVNYGSSYSNAFWDGENVVYGGGDGTTYTPFTCIDIVAHEITHAVTEYSANLEYSYESGALNESFSDIFGICVDFFANPTTANYLMGEQIKSSGTPIRSMEDPNSLYDPDTYQGNYWVTGSSDHGGVHTNSSVQNYWFYLLAEGGNGTNDLSNSYNVTGIGRDKAAEIAYRTLTVYLSMYSQYADARIYSIQSAIDLFGTCSQEVISVTNAWYAVGVGDPFNNAVQASFELSQNFSCSYPVDITLASTSLNADSLLWFSNDIFVSNDDSITLNFVNPGYYDIKLIALGTALCNSSDTLVADSVVYISNTGSPVSTSCSPNSYYHSGGISLVKIGSINNSSSGSSAGYEDFTCTNQASLIAGKFYPIQINTLYSSGENIYVWLDANNNGSFETQEKIFTSNKKNIHTGILKIPDVSNYDTPLRLRIGSDAYSYTLTTACTQPNYGQYEDYTLFVHENTEAPVAEFYASTTVSGTGTTIAFTDSSENLPTLYNWIFEGGLPVTSTLKNPQVFYTTVGDYDATLIVTNAYGTDTIIKTDYIHISNSFNMGDQDSTLAATGLLYDSGGKDGNYQNNENYEFVIAPPCADSIILSVNMLDLQPYYDYIQVYDGTVSGSNLLWSFYSNDTIPEDLVAVSGKMIVTFTSDSYTVYSGFEASWSTKFNNGLIPPIANIEIADAFPPFNTEVIFKDSTLNDPHSWQWNINDEFWSFGQDVSFSFMESGQKFIELIATNCHSSDTVRETVTVQPSPEMSIEISNYTDTLKVGDSIIVEIPVSNLATTGDLTTQINDFNQTEFAFDNNTYTKSFSGSFSEGGVEYPYSYDVQFSSSTNYEGINLLVCNQSQSDYSQLEEELTSKGAVVNFIIGYPYPNLDEYQFLVLDDNSPSYYSSANVREFLLNGGNVVISGDENLSYFNEILLSTGINYQNYNCYNGFSSNIVQHPITNNISEYYINSSALSSLVFTNSDTTSALIYDYNHNLYCAVSQLEKGNILTVSNEAFFNGNISSLNHIQLFNNFIDYGSNNHSGIEYKTLTNSLYLEGQETDTFKIAVSTKNSIGGLYEKDFLITSNDTANSQVIFPVSLFLVGKPDAEYNLDTIDFGLSYVGTSYTESIIVNNTGTDSLFIDSIKTSHADFTYPDSMYRLAVGGFITIDLTLVPSIHHLYNDTLFIYSNAFEDSIHYIRLFGTSEYPPIIETNPDSIMDNMLTNDSVEHLITITNTGTSPLIYKDYYLESASNNSYITEKILEDVKIVSYYNSVYYDFSLRINQLGGIYSNTGSLTNEILDSTDVLLITDNAYLSTSYIDLIRNFVKNGGGLLLAGDYSQSTFNQITTGSGLSFNDGFYCNSGYAPYIADHPITRDLDSIYIGSASSAIIVDDTISSATILVKDEYDNCYSGASLLDMGRIVTIADRVFSNTSLIQYDFEMKCIEWLANKNSWLKVENFVSDTLATNETSSFKVKVNATNLSTGTYKRNIVIPSNDPANENKRIPVTLNVTGIGIISVSKDTILFDTTFNNQFSTKEIVISNIGTENLVISNITSDNGVFSVDSSSFVIGPNKNINLVINYHPTSAGIHKGSLTIESNSKDITSLMVELVGISTLPPIISITPSSLAIKTYPGEKIKKALSLDNTMGGSGLLYDIAIKNIGSDDSSSTDYLNQTLNKLNEGYAKINSIIPNRFDFSDGIYGYYISDGGSDMFDGGNYLYLNDNYSYINYSDNSITSLNSSGATGKYFTRKYNGLFVFVGELNGINSFHVRGNLGASPSSYDSCIIQSTIGSKHYVGFVARMYNYSRPSVNHLIIIEDNTDAQQAFSLNYDDYYHHITNLNSSAIVHHLLFASQSGGYISNEEMKDIMDAYIDVINPSPKWISLNTYSGNIIEGSSEAIEATISTNGLDFGTYLANIEISSNDPENPMVIVPVTLNVVDNQAPEIISNLSNKIFYSCENEAANLKDYFNDPDGDLLIYSIQNTNPDIAFPNIIDDTLLYFNPLSEGLSDIVLSVNDGIHEPVTVNFTIKVIDNNKPEVIDSLPDKQVCLGDDPLMIDLTGVFKDPEKNDLTYSSSCSDTALIHTSLSGSYLVIETIKTGIAIVNVYATDNICNNIASESFILTIKLSLDVEYSNLDNLILYPNPASATLSIKGTKLVEAESFEILNLKGITTQIQIINKSDNQIDLDISGLKPGLYMLKIIEKDGIRIEKFLKQ